MSEDDELDQVRIRSDGSARKRIEVAVDANAEGDVVAASAGSVAVSAALLHGKGRIPIGSSGLAIGTSADAQVRLQGDALAPVQAEIRATLDGHVLTECGEHGATYLNGELLVSGERRPLRRGDSVAVGGEVFYYLPGGTDSPRLAAVKPVDAGRLRSSKPSFTIGRDPSSDLVLEHPTVSLHHARIASTNGVTTIEDLNSAVGVRVNGEQVRRGLLDVGDQIAIGPYSIVFDGEELIEREAAPGLAIEASAVRVDVDAGTILQPIDLRVRAGELVAIIGESGAGKTTLLRALAGVAEPTGGAVLIGGEPVGVRQSDLGYVPQFDIVHDELSAREALDYAACLRLPADTSASERDKRIGEVISELGLADRADLRVSRLSGGQRKRVAVGVELLHRPGALFLDEPTTGLDPGLERHMTELFRQLADTGQTVMLVTHATGSMALYDRVIVMGRGGYMRFDGSPEELLSTFGVEQFDDVYGTLDATADGPPPVGPRRTSRALPPLPPIRPAPAPTSSRVQQSLIYQTRVLTSRYALLVTRDRRHLRSALIQVPVLGLFTAILFHRNVFKSAIPVTEASQAGQLIFLMVTISIWLGAIASAREIVKERSVVDRETAIGVRIPAYLASKLIVLFVFASAQILLFTFIVFALRPPNASAGAVASLLIILLLSGAIAVLMGLVVSALASSEDQATGVIPLLLVPQLLFGGAIVQIEAMNAIVKLIAVFVPSRWAYAAAGHAINLQQRINDDVVFRQVSHYGQGFFTVTLLGFLGISFIFASALGAVTTRLLHRPLTS